MAIWVECDEDMMDLAQMSTMNNISVNNKSITYSITNAAEEQNLKEGERLFNLAVTLDPGEKTLTIHEINKVIRAKRKKIQKTEDKITTLNNLGLIGITDTISGIIMLAETLTLEEKQKLIKDPKFLINFN